MDDKNLIFSATIGRSIKKKVNSCKKIIIYNLTRFFFYYFLISLMPKTIFLLNFMSNFLLNYSGLKIY